MQRCALYIWYPTRCLARNPEECNAANIERHKFRQWKRKWFFLKRKQSSGWFMCKTHVITNDIGLVCEHIESSCQNCYCLCTSPSFSLVALHGFPYFILFFLLRQTNSRRLSELENKRQTMRTPLVHVSHLRLRLYAPYTSGWFSAHSAQEVAKLSDCTRSSFPLSSLVHTHAHNTKGLSPSFLSAIKSALVPPISWIFLTGSKDSLINSSYVYVGCCVRLLLDWFCPVDAPRFTFISSGVE